MQQEYKFYLGLTTKDGQAVDKQKAIDYFASYFDGFNVIESTGYWKGTPEACLIFMVLVDRDVSYIAAGMAESFNQESVLVTSQAINAEFVTTN